jgi:telomerase reverse transcriptase
MPQKRKRTRQTPQSSGQKRQKTSNPQNSKEPIIKHALLAHYYPHIFTLREYLLRRLPHTSKIRRKKILSIGRNADAELEEELGKFLDQTLIGESVCLEVSRQERWSQWVSFSQKGDDSVSTLVNLNSPGVFSQSEVPSPFSQAKSRSIDGM